MYKIIYIGYEYGFMCVCVCARMHRHMCTQSCPNLCSSIDCSPPGSSVHGIFQARILEWVAISSSGGTSWPRDRTWVSYFSCIGSGFFTTSATWEAYQFYRYMISYLCSIYISINLPPGSCYYQVHGCFGQSLDSKNMPSNTYFIRPLSCLIKYLTESAQWYLAFTK